MIPLRVRSWYSLLRGTSSPASLCRRARRFGYRRLALTDRDTLSGLWSFLTACDREGISPLVGAELSDGPDGQGTLVALVKDTRGYRNLCRLITRIKADDRRDLAADPELSAGLVLLTGDPVRLAGLHDAGVSVAADLGNRPTETGNGLRRRARALGVPAVVTPDSELGGEDERPLRELLQAVKTGTVLGRRQEPVAAPLAAPQVYRQRFGVWPEALQATEELAERCSFAGPRFGVVMPPWSGDDRVSSEQTLRIQAYRGARRRYGDDLSEAVVERLEHELRIIFQMGFASYFLVVRDIVRSPAEEAAGQRRRI
ncbi:MAG: PHP domain-containing protein, partial [Desulfofustis sp.]|nr:PHP domain-containing protein [Desulfofustis sp.]